MVPAKRYGDDIVVASMNDTVQVDQSLRTPGGEFSAKQLKILTLIAVLMAWAKMRILLGGLPVTLTTQ
jgi:hypothetical protein